MTDTRHYPRDFFLTLLGTVALYACVVSGITLLFQYTNYALPDPLSDYRDGILSAIRWASAMLIILYPVFAAVTWFQHRDLARHPEKAEYKIRKWMLYLTIFLSACVIIGDLITLIYQFLEGEMSARFFVKVLIVLIVAGLVFAYELWDVRRERFVATPLSRSIEWTASILVAASIIGGFFLIGSPFHQRQVRLDNQRITDLQQIQYQIVEYWVQTQELPADLATLDNPLTGFAPPVDPETGAAYEYTVAGPLQFSLCASFGTSNQDDPRVPEMYPGYFGDTGAQQHWRHTAERTCFERTINPDLYRDRIPSRNP